jgi:hypothetical protein
LSGGYVQQAGPRRDRHPPPSPAVNYLTRQVSAGIMVVFVPPIGAGSAILPLG